MRAKGFTLIELLVAMAIVAIIGVMALGGLRSVIDQQAVAEANAERWREIQFAMRVIVQDLSQIHPRLSRNETGTGHRASFLADPNHQYPLEFSRGGWSNPGGLQRGSVLRVAYDVDQDSLYRIYWPVSDRSLATEPVVTELLTGIREMQVTFFDELGEQYLDWPPSVSQNAGGESATTTTPRAVEFSLTLDDLGRIWRLIETSS